MFKYQSKTIGKGNEGASFTQQISIRAESSSYLYKLQKIYPSQMIILNISK